MLVVPSGAWLKAVRAKAQVHRCRQSGTMEPIVSAVECTLVNLVGPDTLGRIAWARRLGPDILAR